MTEIIQKLEQRFKNQPFGGIVTRKSMPELISVAPLVGERYQIGQFTVTRATVDQLDQWTISKPLAAKVPCPHCGKGIRPNASFCIWCDADL